MNIIMDRNATQSVYKYGTYYNPASRHYGDNLATNVSCDRCHRSHLDVCIGWQTFDLCLQCMTEINRMMNRVTDCGWTKKMPSGSLLDQGQGQLLTRMIQSQFSPNEEIATFMEQDQFKPSG